MAERVAERVRRMLREQPELEIRFTDENVNLIWDRVVTLNGDHPSSSQMCDDVVSDGLLSCGPVGVDRGQ